MAFAGSSWLHENRLYDLRPTSLMPTESELTDTPLMYRAPFVLLAIAVAALLVAGGRAGAAAGSVSVASASPTTHPSASPTATMEFHPGSGSLSGRVVRLTPGGLLVDSAGHELNVDLRLVVDVWKETSVPASAIEIGDNLFINGTAGSPFVAKYVWANIGHVDGVIRAIDATGMLVEVHLRWGGSVLQRIDFSPYIEYGAPAARLPLTRADLVVGRAIGVVIYGRPGGPLRATRIW
jgi:hypothetical protein